MEQKAKSKNKVFVGATLAPDLMKRIRAQARREKRSVSNMLEVFLSAGDKHLSGPNAGK
jgi:hypothetical protein